MKKSYEYASKKRFIAMIMLVMILIVALLSSCFIIREANHDCTGADCPICAVIEQCEDNFRLIGNSTIEIVINATSVVFCCFFGSVYHDEAIGSTESLVTWKIRFNN